MGCEPPNSLPAGGVGFCVGACVVSDAIGARNVAV